MFPLLRSLAAKNPEGLKATLLAPLRTVPRSKWEDMTLKEYKKNYKKGKDSSLEPNFPEQHHIVFVSVEGVTYHDIIDVVKDAVGKQISVGSELRIEWGDSADGDMFPEIVAVG